jgi:hypothetical protein
MRKDGDRNGESVRMHRDGIRVEVGRNNVAHDPSGRFLSSRLFRQRRRFHGGPISSLEDSLDDSNDYWRFDVNGSEEVHLFCRCNIFIKVTMARLARWNVSDSALNYLKQFQTKKNQNISEMNQFETFQVFVLQPWNNKIGVSSDSDSLPSHFHWIWNVSINGSNDFTKWF